MVSKFKKWNYITFWSPRGHALGRRCSLRGLIAPPQFIQCGGAAPGASGKAGGDPFRGAKLHRPVRVQSRFSYFLQVGRRREVPA